MSDAEIERLIQGVDRLVWQLAYKMWPTLPDHAKIWMDVEDLYAEGMVQLCKKAPTWDSKRSKFTTFTHTVVWSHLYKVRMKFYAKKRDPGAGAFVDLEDADLYVRPAYNADDPVIVDAVIAEWFGSAS